MTRTMFRTVSTCAILLLASIMCVLAVAAPASASQGVDLQAVKMASTTDDAVNVYRDGQSFYQGAGVTRMYDLGYIAYHKYYDDWSIAITSSSGSGSVRYMPFGSDVLYSITAVRAGKTTLTCTEYWTKYEYEWNSDTQEFEYVPYRQSQTYAFHINVVSLANTTGALSECVTTEYDSRLFTFNISDLPADVDVTLVSDSNEDGYSSVRKVEAGKVTLYIHGIGTHDIELEACGKTIECRATLQLLSFKLTSALKNTGSLTTYKGKKDTLKVALTGVANPKVTWSSTNSKIATVSKKGVVKGKKKGSCYVNAKVGDTTISVLVEVTSKKAYKAVRNGFADMRTKITYSQAKRMAKKCRDCSSFVSRCYWDSKLGRRIALIGGSGAASWAYNAAGQAKWLNSHKKKRVAKKACALSKLRPGDTVYYETDYAGKDKTQWRYIDHAGLYVGNGLVLNTGGYGGKGSVGLRSYWPNDTSVKFIGRPCP